MARHRAVIGSIGLVLVGIAAVHAQSPGTAGSQDIMPALLAEVRGLRAAMEQHLDQTGVSERVAGRPLAELGNVI